MGKKLPLKFSLYCIAKSMWDMVRNIIELSKRHKNSQILNLPYKNTCYLLGNTGNLKKMKRCPFITKIPKAIHFLYLLTFIHSQWPSISMIKYNTLRKHLTWLIKMAEDLKFNSNKLSTSRGMGCLRFRKRDSGLPETTFCKYLQLADFKKHLCMICLFHNISSDIYNILQLGNQKPQNTHTQKKIMAP